MHKIAGTVGAMSERNLSHFILHDAAQHAFRERGQGEGHSAASIRVAGASHLPETDLRRGLLPTDDAIVRGALEAAVGRQTAAAHEEVWHTTQRSDLRVIDVRKKLLFFLTLCVVPVCTIGAYWKLSGLLTLVLVKCCGTS